LPSPRIFVPALLLLGDLVLWTELVLLWTKGLEREAVFWEMMFSAVLVAMVAYDQFRSRRGRWRGLGQIAIAAAIAGTGLWLSRAL
jgi:hypothetical protein